MISKIIILLLSTYARTTSSVLYHRYTKPYHRSYQKRKKVRDIIRHWDQVSK